MKVGGKEYTEEELGEIIEGYNWYKESIQYLAYNLPTMPPEQIRGHLIF